MLLRNWSIFTSDLSILEFKLRFSSKSFKTFLKKSKENALQGKLLKHVLFYGFSYLHHMYEISSPFLDFQSPMQISPPFLLIDESCTNTSSKLRLNHM
jgi:hypothetical protein